MTRYDTMKAAFYNELEKISGEMQGFTRLGRKPISVEKLLENEAEEQSPSEVFATEKTSALISGKTKLLAGMAAGAGLYHVGTKAKQDYNTGRLMRIQQGGQGY